MRKYISLCVLLFFIVSCKSTEIQGSTASVTIKKLKTSYSDQVSFTLLNASDEEVLVESMKNFYIEKESEGGWVRVPFTPCQCGTPCLPSGITPIPSGEKYNIEWNLMSRKCVQERGIPPLKTIEGKVPNGNYRMTFIINRKKNGMRIGPEELVVSFSIN